jgi:hypothetical protein
MTDEKEISQEEREEILCEALENRDKLEELVERQADKLDKALGNPPPTITRKANTDDRLSLEAKRYKNTVDLIENVVSYYRKALEIKEKEVQFLKEESQLLRGRVDLLSSTLAEYADGVEEYVVTRAIPKANTQEEFDMFESFRAIFDAPESDYEASCIKEHQNRLRRILSGGNGSTAFRRHE